MTKTLKTVRDVEVTLHDDGYIRVWENSDIIYVIAPDGQTSYGDPDEGYEWEDVQAIEKCISYIHDMHERGGMLK